jgi:hypothetical protein
MSEWISKWTAPTPIIIIAPNRHRLHPDAPHPFRVCGLHEVTSKAGKTLRLVHLQSPLMAWRGRLGINDGEGRLQQALQRCETHVLLRREYASGSIFAIALLVLVLLESHWWW